MNNEHASWVDLPGVHDVGEAVVSAMGLAGIEYLFFTSGSEICFYQEAIAKLTSEGRAAPKLITINHEHVGLNAALGHAAVSGCPAVTAVHVDAGTLHQGGAMELLRPRTPAPSAERAASAVTSGCNRRMTSTPSFASTSNGIIAWSTRITPDLSSAERCKSHAARRVVPFI